MKSNLSLINEEIGMMEKEGGQIKGVQINYKERKDKLSFLGEPNIFRRWSNYKTTIEMQRRGLNNYFHICRVWARVFHLLCQGHAGREGKNHG